MALDVDGVPAHGHIYPTWGKLARARLCPVLQLSTLGVCFRALNRGFGLLPNVVCFRRTNTEGTHAVLRTKPACTCAKTKMHDLRSVHLPLVPQS